MYPPIRTGLFLAVCLSFSLTLSPWTSAFAAQEEPSPFLENEWGFVDASMDISAGIPEDVEGRLAKIHSRGKLTVATEPYFPPQTYLDETLTGQDQYVGSDMDLARLIAERMGVELEIIPLEFTDVISMVSEGRYDLAISGLSFTTGRSAILEMSKGYYYSGESGSCGVLIREEDKDVIRALEDLTEKDIVAQSGSLQETLAAENIIFYHKFRRLPTVNEVYQGVRSGTYDAGMVDIETAQAYIRSHPGCGLTLLPDVQLKLRPEYEGDRIAAEKGENELIGFVNAVIDEVLDSGQYDSWYEQHTKALQD